MLPKLTVPLEKCIETLKSSNRLFLNALAAVGEHLHRNNHATLSELKAIFVQKQVSAEMKPRTIVCHIVSKIPVAAIKSTNKKGWVFMVPSWIDKMLSIDKQVTIPKSDLIKDTLNLTESRSRCVAYI